MSYDLFCFADTHQQADALISDLKAQGLRDEQVSLVLQENSQSNEIERDPGSPLYRSRAGTATTVGGVAGTGLGAALGWAVALGATPLGPFVAMGQA